MPQPSAVQGSREWGAWCVVRSALGTGTEGLGLKSSATVPVVIILTVVGCRGMSLPYPHRPPCPHRPPRLTRTTHYKPVTKIFNHEPHENVSCGSWLKNVSWTCLYFAQYLSKSAGTRPCKGLSASMAAVSPATALISSSPSSAQSLSCCRG